MPNSYPCTARPKRGCVAASRSGKLYTAFDVIRIVQRVVSDELCELDEFDAPEAYYKIERGIIAELVKEDEHETNV